MTHTISPENRELELGIQQKINECLDNFESFCFNAGAGAGKTYALQKSIEHILKTKGENLKLSNQKSYVSLILMLQKMRFLIDLAKIPRQ